MEANQTIGRSRKNALCRETSSPPWRYRPSGIGQSDSGDPISGQHLRSSPFAFHSVLPSRKRGGGTVNTHSSSNHSNLRGHSRVLHTPPKNSTVPPLPSNYSMIV
ncbi:hypothetical protein AVEN_61960-1 [Araneus ventricosus]|uniref:Uncharacterized protein n=1 Tax=Araneus ventricosus TaxID=182803 RepID=A0A4Y2SN21_ARAVE|nr:hypothetical protein AVEN_61960-1 [Araneus ventricosus]